LVVLHVGTGHLVLPTIPPLAAILKSVFTIWIHTS
jgi:hypothetical protein